MRVGKLKALVSSKGTHLQAPSVRDSNFLMAAARGRWLFYLKTNNKKVRTKNIVASQLLKFVYFFLRSLIQPATYFQLSLTSIIVLSAFIQEKFHPKLIDRYDNG
jgi:hypothetical protein